MWLFILKLGTTNTNKYQANQVVWWLKKLYKEAGQVVLTWDWYIWCGVRLCVKYDSNILFYYDSLFTYCRNKEQLYYGQSGSRNNREHSIISPVVIPDMNSEFTNSMLVCIIRNAKAKDRNVHFIFHVLLPSILPLNSIVKRIWMDSMHWISMVLLIFYLWRKVSECAVIINQRNILIHVFWDVSPLQYFLEGYQINKIGQRTGMFPPNPMIWSQNLHNRSTVSDTIFTRNTRL